MQDHSTQPPTPKSSRSRSRSLRRLPLSVALSLAAVVLAAGSGTAWWTWNAVKSSAPPVLKSSPLAIEPSVAPPQPVPSPVTAPQPPQPSPAAAQTVQVYWLKSTGNKIELVAQPVAVASQQPDRVLTVALEKLLSGASDANITTIPQGTTLRSIKIEPDGIHVDLSSAFKSGGGSTSMTGRVGQILYTATTIDPNAKVWISVNGEPLRTLGGEGLEIDQPMTREGFEQNFKF